MKILIAEDDLVTRELLKRILVHMADEIIEANDGLEALEMIESEDPDFLFTDIQMPALDGKAIVEAVRSSRGHRLLPIVCMSSMKDKDVITNLVSLGIQDYILKPIRPAEVQERFRKVIAQHSGWRRRQLGAERETLMLVDPDQAFRDFARPFLEAQFSVIDANSGAHALRLFKESEPRPSIVVVSRGLPLIGEVQLKTFLNKLAGSLGSPNPRFWIASDDDASVELASQFDGQLRRTLDADEFAATLKRTLLQGTSPAERLERHLSESAHPWLVSAARQVLGVLSGHEVSTLEGNNAASIVDGVSGVVMLEGQEARVRLLVACSREDAVTLATTVRAKEDAKPLDHEAAAQVLGELGTALGNRARAALTERGFELQGSLPEIGTTYSTDPDAAWHIGEWFVTTTGQRFYVGLVAEGVVPA